MGTTREREFEFEIEPKKDFNIIPRTEEDEMWEASKIQSV